MVKRKLRPICVLFLYQPVKVSVLEALLDRLHRSTVYMAVNTWPLMQQTSTDMNQELSGEIFELAYAKLAGPVAQATDNARLPA